MVSDTLFEAIQEIDGYLERSSTLYQGEERQMILRLRDHMEEVRAWLDTPPEQTVKSLSGTKSESAN